MSIKISKTSFKTCQLRNRNIKKIVKLQQDVKNQVVFSVTSMASTMATMPFQISSEEGWISLGSTIKLFPLSSGVNAYLMPAAPLA